MKYLNYIIERKIFLLYSIVIAIAIIATKEVYPVSKLHWKKDVILHVEVSFFSFSNFALFLLSVIAIFICINTLYNYISTKQCSENRNLAWKCGKHSFFLNLLIWLLWFATYFPGAGMNDTINALISPTSSAIQPIFFQWLIYYSVYGIGKILHSLILGYAAVVFIQMLIMSGVISMTVSWLYKQGISKKAISCIIFYYAMMPAIADYSITLVKDTLFSVSILILTVSIYNFVQNRYGLKITLGIMISSISLLITRSNGFFVSFFSILILMFACGKTKKKGTDKPFGCCGFFEYH